MKEILKASVEDRKRWSKVKTTPGNVILCEQCHFQGFSVICNKIETIRDAYLKLCSQNSDARHIVCAYRLPEKNFPVLQNYEDDDKYNTGSALLRMLDTVQIFNRAIFVIRHYGGHHIGPARFQAYVEAAQSAITHDPYNGFTKTNQTPWPKKIEMELKASAPRTPNYTTATNRGAHSASRGRRPSGPTKPAPYLQHKHILSVAEDPAWDEHCQNHANSGTWLERTQFDHNATDTQSSVVTLPTFTAAVDSLTLQASALANLGTQPPTRNPSQTELSTNDGWD